MYPPGLERMPFFCLASSFDQGSCLNKKVKKSFFSFCVYSSVKNPGALFILFIRLVQNGCSYSGMRTSSEVSAVPPDPQQQSTVSTSLLIAINEPPLIAIFKLSNSLCTVWMTSCNSEVLCMARLLERTLSKPASICASLACASAWLRSKKRV